MEQSGLPSITRLRCNIWYQNKGNALLVLLSIILAVVVGARWYTALRVRKIRASLSLAGGSVTTLKKQLVALRSESTEVRNQLQYFETRRRRILVEMEGARKELNQLREHNQRSMRRIAA